MSARRTRTRRRTWLAAIPRPEGRLRRHRLRREGPDEDRHPRQRSRDVHGEHAPLRRKGEVPEEEYLIPLGKADIKREGTDISLIAHGRAVLTALKAAELLAAEHDINAEVSTSAASARSTRTPSSTASARRIAPSRRGKQTLLRRRRADRRDDSGESVRRTRRAGPARHLARRARHLQPESRTEASSRVRSTWSKRC